MSKGKSLRSKYITKSDVHACAKNRMEQERLRLQMVELHRQKAEAKAVIFYEIKDIRKNLRMVRKTSGYIDYVPNDVRLVKRRQVLTIDKPVSDGDVKLDFNTDRDCIAIDNSAPRVDFLKTRSENHTGPDDTASSIPNDAQKCDVGAFLPHSRCSSPLLIPDEQLLDVTDEEQWDSEIHTVPNIKLSVSDIAAFKSSTRNKPNLQAVVAQGCRIGGKSLCPENMNADIVSKNKPGVTAAKVIQIKRTEDEHKSDDANCFSSVDNNKKSFNTLKRNIDIITTSFNKISGASQTKNNENGCAIVTQNQDIRTLQRPGSALQFRVNQNNNEILQRIGDDRRPKSSFEKTTTGGAANIMPRFMRAVTSGMNANYMLPKASDIKVPMSSRRRSHQLQSLMKNNVNNYPTDAEIEKKKRLHARVQIFLAKIAQAKTTIPDPSG